MSVVGLVAGIIAVSSIVAWLVRRYERIYKIINEIQGPTSIPLIGNLHQFRFNPDEFFEQAQGLAYMFKEQTDRLIRVWIGPLPFVLIYGAEECEAILGSNKMLTKLFHYNFLSPWIGQGLLISKPDKWRPRRKLLTPTFHYDILKDFVQVYNRHAKTLVSKFDKLAEKGQFTDIFHTITLCTLDIICEAALGVNIYAQTKHTDYLDAVFRMKYIVHQRQIKPQYYPELIFNWFGSGREQQKCVEILHNFTNKAIIARKKAMEEAGGIEKLMASSEHSRMAFLDLMLDMMNKGELDLDGIQEEVDTFTFEGHDTTSAALNWFLHLMGAHPECQAKAQREIDDMMGDNPEREITFDDLGNFKYIEACLRETLRMYPSVPLFARQVTEDTQIKNFTLPAGTGVVIVPSMVHRDPKYWPNPEVFDPDRFLGDGLSGKHPYCYIPFSAGARNCIGQRFANMEEKCLIVNILRRFKVESKLRTDQMRVAAELIIRPMYGNLILFTRRSFGEY
ncbi:cytochrome p450 domain-containing protein [Ditylenchus destructor]|nr:cytochrome p450 domain-containing protein [Ditylenchus destructor]